MPRPESEPEKCRRLRRERNFFATCALCGLASLGLAVPRKVGQYRALKEANARLVDLQHTITLAQERTREVEAEILRVQQQIRERTKP